MEIEVSIRRSEILTIVFTVAQLTMEQVALIVKMENMSTATEKVSVSGVVLLVKVKDALTVQMVSIIFKGV